MELCKLNLPNGMVNIDYGLGEEGVCKTCKNWRFYQELFKCHLNHKKVS